MRKKIGLCMKRLLLMVLICPLWDASIASAQNISGQWQMVAKSATSNVYGAQVTLSGILSTTEGQISGILSLSGALCASQADVSGTIRDGSITAVVFENALQYAAPPVYAGTLSLTGTVSSDGSSAGGTYTFFGGCQDGDYGTWSGTRSVTGPSQAYTIETLAGGSLPTNVPGPAVNLSFSYSSSYFSGTAIDKAGNVFFSSLNAVFRLDAVTGMLTVVAGNGTRGFSGDNGPAITAKLNEPGAVALDTSGNLYIADLRNSRIRMVSNGVITTVAGGGSATLGDGGPAINATLSYPTGVAVDSAGNLYIADYGNNCVRMVSNGVITTVVGNGVPGFGGDGGLVSCLK
jgi:hypothetical protein